MSEVPLQVDGIMQAMLEDLQGVQTPNPINTLSVFIRNFADT